MAWVLKNPVVSAPIVGATKPNHLTDAVATLALWRADALLEKPGVDRRIEALNRQRG